MEIIFYFLCSRKQFSENTLMTSAFAITYAMKYLTLSFELTFGNVFFRNISSLDDSERFTLRISIYIKLYAANLIFTMLFVFGNIDIYRR